ncbi:MAG: helix-turn-helix domain-containing protein [Bacteroidales bacterium]|jgi:hypothetical protein|nr:helix-turn-helix domain-containing protein [Bacteroidales bacterium]
MNKPKHISEILRQMAQNPQSDLERIVAQLPCMQAITETKSVNLNLVSDEELDAMIEKSFLEDWIDGQDVMQILHISPRTLQNLRSNGTLPFSRIGNKIYYLRRDILKILSDNYIMYKIRNNDK